MTSGAASKSSKWLALIWLIACVDAVTIKSSNITTPASDLGQFQTLEKTWSVSGSTGIRNLLVHAPGIVYVDYDASLSTNEPDALSAKVVLTGDSEDLMDAFQVLPWDESAGEGLELRFRPGEGAFQGHLLTRILVGNKQVLQIVKSVSSADVVISGNVFSSDGDAASVELTALGPGDVTVVSTEKLYTGTLSILAAASGNVVVQAPSIEATKSISVNSVGSGDVAIVADEVKTDAVNIKSVGDGGIYVQTDNAVTITIDALLSGSGDVTFSRSGSCVHQRVKLVGDGDFVSGSIVSEFADVGVYGSGNALVQAKEKLVATITGSGELHYVNDEPREVVVRGRQSSLRDHSPSKEVKQAHNNDFDTYKPHVQRQERIPPLLIVRTKKRENKSGHLRTSSSDDDDDSLEESVVVITPDDSFSTDTETLDTGVLSLSGYTTSDYLEVFLCIMVGIGAMLKYRKRRLRDRILRRNQYTPLVVATAAIEGIVVLLSQASNASTSSR
ncbi:hypothetical protein Gpo141_00006794 [Globisporangium polare]